MNWKDSGLNIFLSVKVCDLPQDLFLFTSEQKNKTLCLVANGGKSLWEKLSHPLKLDTHPFDQYTVDQIKTFAKIYLKNDCEILYPNDDYTLPLQRIGRYLNLCSQSPIGLDICEEFGLWFAFRGVFLTSENVITKKIMHPPTMCKSCIDRPCLQFSNISLARLTCPIKVEHQYNIEQIMFHKSAMSINKI